MTKPVDTEAIEARVAAATPGPWEARALAYSTCVGKVGEYQNLARLGDPLDRQAWRNADLIAHAPTDLAALVAEVRTLRDRLDAAERVVEAAEALNVEMDSLIIGGLSTPGQHAASALGAALDAWRGGGQ